MRKQGPCRHCGITSTPLWRNGPPEKPVLCNACGSRWRTKGTLKNYTPLHCRGPLEEEHSAAPKRPPFKCIEDKLCTRKQDAHLIKNKHDNSITRCAKDLHTGPHDNISNWSSSGSAISFAESCSHFSIADSSEVTGSVRSNISDCLTPSCKRKPEIQPRASSPVEKLTEDLHSILHQHPLYLESSEEYLLYDNMSSVDYNEIGHGGFLIRNMNCTTRESGSTSSSLHDLRNKTIHSDSVLAEDIWSDGKNSSMDTDIKMVKVAQEYLERGLCLEECQILLSRDSVLGSINLEDVISYDIFMTHFTPQEQERLMKYLPSTDINNYPESVRTMFCSLQFEETLCNFRDLICEGVLDHSSYTGNACDYQTLQQLVLFMPTKCSWVEHYTRIKPSIYKGSGVMEHDHKKGSCISSSCSTSLKRTYSSLAIESPVPKFMERSPRKKSKIWMLDNHHSPSSLSTNLRTHLPEESQMEIERSGFGPNCFFTSPLEKSCISNPPPPPDENSYDNLLIDASSSSSFPEAVLLCTLWEGKQS